jgi:hypothetical protein
LALNSPFSRGTKPYGGNTEGGRGKQGRQGRRKGAVGRIAKNILFLISKKKIDIIYFAPLTNQKELFIISKRVLLNLNKTYENYN